jgi:predicted PurR-regulated permease PerM
MKRIWSQILLVVLGILIVLAVVAFFIASSIGNNINNYYFGANGNILEQKDISNFKAVVTGIDDGRVLEISGLDQNSSLVTDKLYTSQNGDVLNVRISQTITHPNASGSFNYKVSIPETSVDTVTFGNTKTIIWSNIENAAVSTSTPQP